MTGCFVIFIYVILESANPCVSRASLLFISVECYLLMTVFPLYDNVFK